ncbi:MAG: glycosyltransferase [Candidatus Omnitrophota bacterium]
MKEISTIWWDQFQLPAALKRNKIDVFFSPYIKTPVLRACTYVNTVADVIPLEAPKYKGLKAFLEKIYFFVYAFICSHRAASVVTLSKDAKEKISKVFGVNPQKIEVVYPSVDKPVESGSDEKKIEEIVRRHDLCKPYLLYVGNFKRHKNLVNLVAAFELLPDEVKNGYRLLLVGGSESEVSDMKRLIAKRGLDDRVIPVANIENKDVYVFLKNAAAFIFPSLMEGFGIPPVEAMAAGVPVAASNLAPMTEVLGNAVLFFDPYDPGDISRTIIRLLKEKDTREECIARGSERLSLFRARDMSRKMLDILRHAFVIPAKKALVLNLGGMGNTILVYPLIKALKEGKGCQVRLVVAEGTVFKFLKALGFTDAELIFLKKETPELVKMIRQIGGERIDLGIASAYTNWVRSWIFFVISGIRRKIGFVPAAFSFLFDRSVQNRLLHEYELYRKFADFLDLSIPEYPKIDIKGEIDFADKFFKENDLDPVRVIIGMHAGSGEKQAHFRRWPIDRFASLIDLIGKELKGQVILLGGPNEKDLEEKLSGSNVKFVSSIGRTDFHQLASLARRCDVVVGNDSGVMHFAAALGTPVVAIFGPTDYRITRPLSEHVRIVRKDLECSPCYKRGRISCEAGRCFSAITVQDVFSNIKEILGETGRLK